MKTISLPHTLKQQIFSACQVDTQKDVYDVCEDHSSYFSMAGTLQYLNITRLDIAYVVQQLCLHMHSPRDCHSALLKRVMHYIKGTTTFSVKIHALALPSITTYSNIDWAGCPDTRHSTSGFCVFLRDALMLRPLKRQPTVSRSSVKVEYRGITNV